VTQALGGPGKFRIPFRITGTVENPRFVLTGTPRRVQEPQAQQQTEEQKKKKKLFGIF
jgi:hypothetical protein